MKKKDLLQILKKIESGVVFLCNDLIVTMV